MAEATAQCQSVVAEISSRVAEFLAWHNTFSSKVDMVKNNSFLLSLQADLSCSLNEHSSLLSQVAMCCK